MSINSNLTESQIETNSISILYCPYCTEKIPNLFLKPSEGQLNICIQCSCLSQEEEIKVDQFITKLNTSTSLDDKSKEHRKCFDHEVVSRNYCNKCKEWLCEKCKTTHQRRNKDHEVIEQEINIECNSHKMPYAFYCLKCHLNFCNTEECLSSHSTHNVVELTIPDILIEDPNFFDKVIAQNKKRADSLISKIDQQISELNQKKETIKSAHGSNAVINKNLIVLYQRLGRTVITFKFFPCYELMTLRQTIVINTQEYIEEDLSIEEEYNKLKLHLETSFVLKQITNKCKNTLIGHKESVNCLIKLNDNCLASGSNDKTIKFWNILTNECTSTLEDGGWVYCLLQLSDKRLCSGSSDNSIKLWNVDNNTNIAKLTGHTSSVHCLIELKDGRLASGSDDSSIRLWDTIANECKVIISAQCSVYCLVIMNDDRLVSGSYTIKLWNTAKNECTLTLTGHQGWVYCLVMLKNGNLASGSVDKTIKVWNIKNNEGVAIVTLADPNGLGNGISSLLQLQNGVLVSGSYDNAIRQWNTDTNECIRTLKYHQGIVFCLVQVRNNIFASGSGDNTIKIWDS